MESTDWRSSIISQLQARNKFETSAFQDLITFQSKLFDSVNTLKTENLQLTLQNERIRFTGSDIAQGGSSNERVQALEQKILAQQEELTNLHRRRGENSQQIINLNARVHEADKELNARDVIIADDKALIVSLRAEIQLYETNMTELQSLNQVLRDEYQALQTAFVALEEKLRKVQDENRALVERLIKYKAKDADKMNEENDNFIKSPTAFLFNTFGRVSFGKKGEKVRKELEEAAREGGSRSSVGSGGSISEDRILDVPFYMTSSPEKVALRFDAHDGEVNAVKWSPTDRILATGGADRKIKLWDVCKSTCEGHCRGTLVGANLGMMSVDFDSTGMYIVGSSNDFASRVWTVNDQRLRHTLTGHSGKVMAAKFLSEPTKVISGSHDRTLKIWDLQQNGRCTETKFAGSSCNDLVTSDGAGSTIISGHYDKSVRFWDIRAEMAVNSIPLNGRVTSLDISRDSDYLLACVRDNSLQLIDLRRNSIVRSFSHDLFRVGCDWSRAAFGPGGRLIAVGGQDGVVYIWNTTTGKRESMLEDHKSTVTAVSWNLQTGLLASVDKSKRVVIWGDL